MPALDARLVLAALAAAFLLLGTAACLGERRVRGRGRTWLLVGAIFGAVSAWLWSR